MVKALHNQIRGKEPLHFNGSRSQLIRDLSVFISHLDSIARPGTSNFALLDHASRTFSQILDEVLEPRPLHMDGQNLDLAPAEIGSLVAMDDLSLLDNMDFGTMFDQWLV